MLWSLIGDRIRQTCFGIMGRCPRNVNDWLRALVIVTLYNFVQGHASSTEVLKSSMQFLSTKQKGRISNPTTYPWTSDVSIQYTQSSSKVFTRLKETTGDWYGISSSIYTSDPEFSENQEYSDTIVLLEEPLSATEITSLVNSVDKQTPTSNYDHNWTSSITLVWGSLTKGTNKNDTTLGSSEPRTNNINSRVDSIPKLNSTSTQLSNINSVISSNRLDTKLAPTKSSEASLLPHPNVSSLQKNQDTAEMSHSSDSTSESFQSYFNKETLSHSLETSSSSIDLSFSSVDKFVGDQTLYPSSVLYPFKTSTPISNTFPSGPTGSPVVNEWPTSVHKENATRLFSSRKNLSTKENNSKTSENFKSTSHISDHPVFSKPDISTEHALLFKVSSINTSKHSLSESHNSSLPLGIQQSVNTETSVLLSEDHRTTVPIQVIKSNRWETSVYNIIPLNDGGNFEQFTSDMSRYSPTIYTSYSFNKGGSGSIAENEIKSTQSFIYKSASSISTTYLEFYTTSYVEDSLYDTHLLQPSETTVLGLSDVLDSSSSTETIPTTVHFHSTLDLSLFSSVPSGESDRLDSPFEIEETESTRTGRELSWSDTYSNNVFSNVIESDTMTALPNKQIQTSAIMPSSVQIHRDTPRSTHKEENTTKAVEKVMYSSFNTEFKTSLIDALESSSQVKEPKTTANLYSTNIDFQSDTNDQFKTASEVRVSKTMINQLSADTGYRTNTTDQLKSSTQLGESKTLINPFSTGFQTSRIEKLKSSSQETKTVTNLSPTNTKFQTNTIDQLKSSTQVEESTIRESLFTFDFQTSRKDKLKSSSMETELKSMNVRFSTDTVFQTNTFDQLRSSGHHLTTEFNRNRIETPTSSQESITTANLFSTDSLPQTNTLDQLKSITQMEESKAKEHGFTTDFQSDMINKRKSSLRERESLSNNIMNPFSTETDLKTNYIDVFESSTQVEESKILENLFSSKSEFQVNHIKSSLDERKSSLDERKSNTIESHFSSNTEVLRTNTRKTSSQVREWKTNDTPDDQQSTQLYFYDEIHATPFNTVMFQSVHVGTSKQMISPVKLSEQTIHFSVTVSYYSSILQDLQTSYHSVPGEGDHWTTTKEPLHISSDNSAELLSKHAASKEAINAQSKQTGEQMRSVFSQTLPETMSPQLASSADFKLLSSFKENNLSLETHAIYAYQSKLQTTIDDLLSTASATNNATNTKPSALIHSSFGDSVGHSLHSTIGGHLSSGDLNSTVIKMTVPTMDSFVKYDKTSSNFTSEETPLITTISRFANRNGVENRTVKPLDTTDYFIMSSVYYNDAEITSQSILSSSMPIYANTQPVQIRNLLYSETSPAQSSIETKYVYQVTSGLKTTYKNLLPSYPIYATTISTSFSRVHSHVVRTMSQAVMSVAGSDVQSQVKTDHTSSSSLFASNADLSVKVQEESDVFDRESSSVYFSSSYSSDRPLLEFSFSRGATPFETKYIGSSMIKDPLSTHEIALTNAIIEQTTITPEILQTSSLMVVVDSETIGLLNDKSLKDNQMLSALSSKRSDWVSESIHLQQKQTSDHSEIQSSISESAILPTSSYNNWNLYASTIKTITTISTPEHVRLDSSVKGSTIHSSVTVSYYSSILQDLQTSYHSVPGEGDHWTTTKEPLHISSDNSAELLSKHAASKEAINAQSKQTGEQMRSVFSQTLPETMSPQLASSADFKLLSSFKENNLSLETHAIYAYQSKLQTTIDDLLSTASATNNATNTKPSALIHSSFGDSVGYSLHSTIGGHLSSGDLNSTVIKMTVPTMDSFVNYDKTSSNFTSEETPLITTISRFANRNGVENRTVKPLDTTDYFIMSSVYYNDAEITSQSILSSSMPIYANTQPVQIHNLLYSETSPAQSSIETKYVYQVTSDLKTTYKNLLPIYATTISTSFSRVHSHVVRTMSQAVMSVAGSDVQSQVKTDHTSSSSVFASNADLSVKVQEESDVFDRESSSVYFSSSYSSDRPLLEFSFSRGATPFETKYIGSSMIKDPLSTHEIALTNAIIEQTTITPEILQTSSLMVVVDSETIGLLNDKSLKDNQMLSALSSKSSDWVSESIHLQQKQTSDHSEIQSSISESAILPTSSYNNWNLYASTIKTITTISTPEHVRLDSSVKGSIDTTISTSEHVRLDSSVKWSSDTTISTSEHIRLDSSVKGSSDTTISKSEHIRLGSSVKWSSDTTISTSEHIRLDSSVKGSSDRTMSTSEYISLDNSVKGLSETQNTERFSVSLEAKPTSTSTLSRDTVPSSSITVHPYPENNLLIIEIDVKLGIDISQENFKEKLEEGLTTIYVEGMSQRRRRSSSQQSLSHTKDTGIFVKIKDMKRKSGERVEIIFLVTYNGIVVSASLAEMAFQKMSDIKMSAILGYPVVVPVSRLISRKESPSDDSWWGGLFNPLVITLISVPASIVVIATVIAIVYQCRSKSIQRYPSVPSQMDSLYKHNLVVDVENGDVRNRRIFYDYPSDDEFSMTSSEAFNEIKHKYSQSMHSKIRNFEKLNTKNHFYNQLERKPSDAVRNKVTFGLDGDDNKCRCTKTDSNESNDSGVILDAPKSLVHEQNNLKLDVPNPKASPNVQSPNDSQAASKSVILQNPYPVKKKSNLVNLSGERVTSWVFMGENTNVANECIPESCDSKQIMIASNSVTQIAQGSNYIPPQHGVECQASDQDALPGVQDHFYETLNRKEPSKCDHSTGTQTQSGISGSDGFEYLEPLRQLLLAVEQQRRRVPPVDQFLNDETVFKQSFQGLCNLEHRTPISPTVKSPQLPLKNFTDGYNSESGSKNESDVCSIGSDKRTQNETQERKERQLVKGIDTKCEEISCADSCTYNQPFLYPVGFAHTAEI